MPHILTGAKSVQYGDTFFVVGGMRKSVNSFHLTDSVLVFDLDAWSFRPTSFKLSEPKAFFTAVRVEEASFPSCQ